MKQSTKLIIIAAIIFITSISISIFFLKNNKEETNLIKTNVLQESFEQIGSDNLIMVYPSEKKEEKEHK